MAKTSPKLAANNDAKDGAEIEHDDNETLDDNELAGVTDNDSIKTDSRRKIEIYWEKKRLKEEFDDFDESEFGF